MTRNLHSKNIFSTSGKFFLAVILLFSGTICASSQNRKSKKKKPQKTETVIKKTPANTTSKAKQEEIYVSPCYEGDLLYRNEEFHSKFIRTMSGGMAYNGDRSVLLTLCEEGIRISDLDMHFHTVIIPDENICYVYSELLDYGYILSMDQVRELYNSLDLDYVLHNGDPNFKKRGEFSEAEEKMEYTGDNCSVIRGMVRVGDSGENETEMWVYKCVVPEAYKYFTYGYAPGGIVKRMIINSRMDLPLFGNMKSMIASELVAVEERPVDIEELFPPQSIHMRKAKDIGKLYGYNKAVNKQLKKLKLKPKTKKSKEVKRNIQAKWDFADEWFNTALHSQYADNLEKELSNSFYNVLNSIASLGNNKTVVGTESDNQKSKSGTENSEKPEQKDLIYIPDLIKEIELSAYPIQSKVDNYDSSVAYNASHSRKKRVRIGSKYIYVSEVTGMRKPVIDKTGYQAAKSVVADTRRIIDLVIQYGQNNNTDFIPRESYNKISKAVSGASMANLKRATKNARDRKLSNFKKYYSQYASMLMSEYYSNHDRDFNWIKTCQREMKRLREETGCDKSPWETWDGITDPTK